ncbi:MAG TPA: signal peptidase I [Bryobacteraceae bacterium]|jgi:signal peptidase I|nr:signal peptidase I [Bryobacteraceae bacterium]
MQKESQAPVRGFVAEWAVTIVLLLFGTTTALQAFVIPTGSMEDTLLVGDHLLVDKLVYAPADSVTSHLLPYRDVQRGDVIIFRYPLDIKETYVKRAIGIPGDRLHFENKRLILNGRPVDEPYTLHVAGNDMPYRDDFPSGAALETLRPEAAAMLAKNVVNGELVVPPGFVFAMGDNRENSDDSRFWGLVPRENIFGTPIVIYWSFDAPSAEMVDPNISLDHLLNIGEHFFTKTRWSRTLNFIHSYPLQR